MSYRPPPHAINTTFPPRFNSNFIVSVNNEFVQKPSGNCQANLSSNPPNYNDRNPPTINQNVSFSPTVTLPPLYNANNPFPGALPPPQFYNSAQSLGQQTANGVPFPYQSSANNFPGRAQNSGSIYSNFTTPYNQYFPNTVHQNPQILPAVHSTQNFPYSPQNVNQLNAQPATNFESLKKIGLQNVPTSNFSTVYGPQNSVSFQNSSNVTFSANKSVTSPSVINSQASHLPNNNNFVRMPHILSNVPQEFPMHWKDSFPFSVPPPTLQTGVPCVPLPENVANNVMSEKEQKLASFLQKYSSVKQEKEKKLTVPEYQSKLIAAFSIMNLLIESKSKMQSLLDSHESVWNSEMQYITYLKMQLSELCTFINSDDNLSRILRKLKCIKRKREQKRKTKLNKLSEKIKAEQNRKELHQQIDKWLDDLKEKNMKIKRELEMKKEADFILLEVRRKIHEANKTIEKIKVLEKLRNARQMSAVQKGLRVQPEHDENFQKKMSLLKETMLHQLKDYEAEEKALKVMLETEQEGQREELFQWEIKKMKTKQQKRQNHITECLFGNSDVPLPTDPLYLFHKYHASANNGIESLVHIRHQWDMLVAEGGEAVPQQWVVPVNPSNSMWEKCLETSGS